MSLPLDRTVIFVNPTAGGGRAGAVWRKLVREAPETGEARVVLAATAAAARRELDEHLAGGVRAVVGLGGDGTAHLLANHLLETGLADRVALGLIPAGTGSDLAHCLGMPRRPLDGWRRLRAAEPRAIDVLEAATDAGERRFAVNIASAGVSGAISEKINAGVGRGPLVYLRAIFPALAVYRPVPCRVTVDGEELDDGGFFVVAVANGRSFGRGLRIAPLAELDDGLADVVLIRPIPLWQVPWRLPRLYAGSHLGLPFVRHRRGRSVRLEPRGDLPLFEVDGETMPSGPATVRVLPGALRVLAG